MRRSDVGCAHWVVPLVPKAGARFTVHGVIVVQAQSVEPIIAPSCRLHPDETAEASQVAARLPTHRAQPGTPCPSTLVEGTVTGAGCIFVRGARDGDSTVLEQPQFWPVQRLRPHSLATSSRSPSAAEAEPALHGRRTVRAGVQGVVLRGTPPVDAVITAWPAPARHRFRTVR
jgi:hypothetical protein